MHYPSKVYITEVGPRDGLQNEKELVSTDIKLSFIHALMDAGHTQIEASSFVSPQWVPQMGDAKEIFAGIQKRPGVRTIALVPNQKGLEKALASQVDSIALFTAASESFTKKNINRTIEESLQDFERIVQIAKPQKIWIRGYISTCFGCPYEGEVNPQKVLEVLKRLLRMGVDEISIGDTIGVATPYTVTNLLELISKSCSFDQVALHFHDTRGIALANVLVALQSGIYRFDSSAGGLGGCPYAPGAAGNLATEDLVYMLDGMGIETGIDFDKLCLTSKRMEKILRKTLPSKSLQANVKKCEFSLG